MLRKPKETPGRQALKTQRTRERLINSTIFLIKNGGLTAATSSRIAEHAGLTWGAVQHQFGLKEDILQLILEISYQKFIRAMTVPVSVDRKMSDRVSAFVDRMWRNYQSDLHQVAMEILLATRGRENQVEHAWEVRRGAAHLKAVREFFPESKLNRAGLQEALTFTHCCLTGLSIEGIFETRVKGINRHLHRIKLTLSGMLSGD